MFSWQQNNKQTNKLNTQHIFHEIIRIFFRTPHTTPKLISLLWLVNKKILWKKVPKNSKIKNFLNSLKPPNVYIFWTASTSGRRWPSRFSSKTANNRFTGRSKSKNRQISNSLKPSLIYIYSEPPRPQEHDGRVGLVQKPVETGKPAG